ncbi:MAG TPA: XdhC/CoxI family protein [Candidatus Dormibacteraeota bacterium]|nr:XdhC/CoxI family protein [Candidatus Dormibacteraeota bacterium]
MPSLEEDLAHRVSRGEEVVLATVIKVDGEPPSRPGAKILLSRTAALAGTLGCSEFDSAALADAAQIADAGVPSQRTYRHDLGSIEVYLEPYAAAPTLVVFAATPVAAALLRWAPELGFRTLLVETRPGRLKDAAWPPAVTSLDELPGALGQEIYAVHTDHDAGDLVAALETLLPKAPRFIGLVGSRRHTGHHLEALRVQGVSDQVIAQIQSPVGLDLGAVTPGEIALSILAGIVAIRRGGGVGWKQDGAASRT